MAKMPHQFEALATYNGEVARGIVHTDAWKAEMGKLQELFNLWQASIKQVVYA